MDLQLIDQASSIIDKLAAYHKHEVVGLEHVPKSGRCLLVVNHSLATYDIVLLQNAILRKIGRIPRPLMDRWFFKIKFMGDLMRAIGAIEGEPNAARKLLESDELICVAPGGMRESIRPSTERYQIMWGKRKGFVKLAIETQAPVLLAACPKADDIFEIYPTPLSLWFYHNFKLPFAILRGIGLTPIPRPVMLTHFISEALIPPKIKAGEEATPDQVKRFHAKIVRRMKELMGEALTHRSASKEDGD